MPNDLKLQEGHPVDENLRPIKVGGKSTAIETAQHDKGARVTGDLEVTGDVSTDQVVTDTIVASGDLKSVGINAGGNTYAKFQANASKSTFTLYEDEGSSDDDYMQIATAGSGVTTINTVDAGGTDADLTISVDGDMAINSATGKFIAKNDGTEFSVAGSSYAGMILGYRCIGEDATPVTYTLTTSMVTIHADANIKFKAPPSGKVEVNFQAHYYGGGGHTVTLGLSDTATYSALSSGEYEKVSFDTGRADDAVLNQNWVVTGLTAGTEYNYWIGAKTSSTTLNPSIKYGGDSTGENVPLIIKITALPATTLGYAVYG